MKKYLTVAFLLSVYGGMTLAELSWGQAPAPPVPAPPRTPNVTVYGADGRTTNPYGTFSGSGQNFYYAYPGGPEVGGGEIANLVKQLRDTDDEAKKSELTKQLETAVAKYFDDDMKARENELTKIEERLNKLRTQLDRRRKAKAEITQLQTKVLINEAEGLGFSSGGLEGDGRGGFRGFPGAPGAPGAFPGGAGGFSAPAVAPAPVAVPPPAAPGATPAPRR